MANVLEFLRENKYVILLVALISMFLGAAIHGYHDGEQQLARESFDLVKQFSAAILTIIAPALAKAASSGNGKPPEPTKTP